MKQTTIFESVKGAVGPGRLGEKSLFSRIRDEGLDFRDIPASTGVYGIHPYPAMLHFLVVRRLLVDHSKPGSLVLDPFLGSGVVAVESLLHARRFVGYDINPLAVLISKARARPLASNVLKEAISFISARYTALRPQPVEFHNIRYWFDEETIAKLSRLRGALFSITEEPVRDFFQVAFSETVRRVSRTRYNEFKLLRRKDARPAPNVLMTFRDVSLRNTELLTSFYEGKRLQATRPAIEVRNIQKGIPVDDASVDLVITSPPYGDSRTTVAYGQFSRLSLRWLGLKESVDRTSLGSHRRAVSDELPSSVLYQFVERVSQKDQRRAEEVFSFYYDLFCCIRLISKKVRPGGYACLVVGNRTVKGIELPTDKVCADFFEATGFRHHRTLVRAISNKRMPAENSPSNIKGQRQRTMRYEYIVILQKRS